MKIKVTRKYMKETYGNANIYCIGYCNLQHLLRFEEPFAYSTRAEGWACDYYELPGNVIISTGYAPIGKDVNYNIQRQFDDAAREILCNEYSIDNSRERLNNLIADFVGVIKAKN